MELLHHQLWVAFHYCTGDMCCSVSVLIKMKDPILALILLFVVFQVPAETLSADWSKVAAASA